MLRRVGVYRSCPATVHVPYPEFELGHDQVCPTPETLPRLRSLLHEPGTARSQQVLVHPTDQLGAWLDEREEKEKNEATARETEEAERRAEEVVTAREEEKVETEVANETTARARRERRRAESGSARWTTGTWRPPGHRSVPPPVLGSPPPLYPTGRDLRTTPSLYYCAARTLWHPSRSPAWNWCKS